MELLYIWIGEYKNLKNVGLNFTNEYKIEVKTDENSGEAKEIIIEKNKEKSNYNIFGDGSLKSINAIIGENGTGKTSILEFIKEFINGNFVYEKRNFPDRNSKYIIVYKDTKEEKIYCRAKEIEVIKNGDFIIQYENYDENNKRIYYRLDLTSEKKIESEIPELREKTSVIYHSNIFDYKREENTNKDKNFINMSTNNLLNNYKGNYHYIRMTREEPLKKIEEILKELETVDDKNIAQIKKEFEILRNGLSDIDTDARIVNFYKMEEFRRQINFFNNVNKENKENITNIKFIIKKEINIPKNIIFTVQNPFMYAKILALKIPKIRNILSEKTFVEENGEFETKKNVLKLKFIMNIYDIFYKELQDFRFIENIEESEIDMKSFNSETFLDKYIINNLKKESKYKEKIEEIYEKFIEGIKKLEEKNIDKELDIKIGLEQEEKINNFLEISLLLPKNSKEDNQLINYGWDRDMSTGEKEILSFLSRIYSCIDDIYSYKGKDKIDDILILLDEPDIHLHPEWQRKLVSILIEFINHYFKEKRVQIILTSHSPFVISDLPRENVILLKKKYVEKKFETKVETKEMSSTFAANIHTLFKNSFFVTSTFGEFAKNKIKEVINHIENGEIEKNKEMIDYIISIVGEPLIKTKLENMRYEKMSNEDKIKELEARIDRLKKGEQN